MIADVFFRLPKSLARSPLGTFTARCAREKHISKSGIATSSMRSAGKSSLRSGASTLTSGEVLRGEHVYQPRVLRGDPIGGAA